MIITMFIARTLVTVWLLLVAYLNGTHWSVIVLFITSAVAHEIQALYWRRMAAGGAKVMMDFAQKRTKA